MILWCTMEEEQRYTGTCSYIVKAYAIDTCHVVLDGVAIVVVDLRHDKVQITLVLFVMRILSRKPCINSIDALVMGTPHCR